MSAYDVVVLGSCMVDLVCYAPRLPKNGETLQGSNFIIGQGGKGANQCVAAVKLGASCALIARLGDDSFGKEYVKSLVENRVDISNVILTENISSGMAQITVADNGDNHIVIVPGANNKLSVDDVKKAGGVLLNAKVVTFQFEVPLTTTIEALKYIHKNKTGDSPFTIVNGAPAISNIDPSIYTLCDCFCINESEAEAVTGVTVQNIGDAYCAIEILLGYGCKLIILTLGKDGVLFATPEFGIVQVPVEEVTPVDTTGAGDAFIGAFAYFTANFTTLPLKERIRRSCAVATMSVLHRGTQSSFPRKENLPEELFTS